MINNLPAISSLLKFEQEGDFYLLQVIQRRKENPSMSSNSRIIKSYYISSRSYLDDRFDEIVKLCKVFDARAMINLNVRSYEKVAYKAMVNIANSMSNSIFKSISKCYDNAVCQTSTHGNKTWVIDIDERYTINLKRELEEFIKSSQPNVGSCKILLTLPSKNGTHLITKPFRLDHFKEKFPQIEVHKNNPTNLIII